MDEIARLEALEGQEINDAKIVLANEVTAMCHGRAAAETAEKTARETFVAGGAGDDLPTVVMSAVDFPNGGLSIGQFFLKAGLVDSGKAAKRLIADGGAKLNDQTVTDPGMMITPDQMNQPLKLSAGKKRHALAKLG